MSYARALLRLFLGRPVCLYKSRAELWSEIALDMASAKIDVIQNS